MPEIIVTVLTQNVLFKAMYRKMELFYQCVFLYATCKNLRETQGLSLLLAIFGQNKHNLLIFTKMAKRGPCLFSLFYRLLYVDLFSLF